MVVDVRKVNVDDVGLEPPQRVLGGKDDPRRGEHVAASAFKSPTLAAITICSRFPLTLSHSPILCSDSPPTTRGPMRHSGRRTACRRHPKAVENLDAGTAVGGPAKTLPPARKGCLKFGIRSGS